MSAFRVLLAVLVAVRVTSAAGPGTEPAGAVASDPAAQSPATKRAVGVESPIVKLRAVPKIRLDRAATTTRPAAQLRKPIAGLSKIDQPDFGLSPTMTGWAFAPIAGLEQSQAFLLTNHRLKTPEAFVELVKAGPPAIPYLLEALEDKTPTGLTIGHEGIGGGMWFDRELPGNPLNPREQAAAEVLPDDKNHGTDSSIHSYTVKVGDVCFVALGQIVGREYLAVRYQPTACIVINSPTQDHSIAEYVRKAWAGQDPEQCLLDSLLLDYSSEGIFNGQSLDGWDLGSDLQVAAATRMLYYFPRETAGLIADRLRGLRVSKPGGGVDAFIKREVANGVRTESFVKAVAWCREPAVDAEVVSVLKRTDDPKLLVAAAQGVGQAHRELVLERLRDAVEKLPAEEQGPFGDGYRLLVTLGRIGGEKAKPLFTRYMSKPNIQRCRTMSHVLCEIRAEWAIDLLLPLLDDTRDTGWSYAVKPGEGDLRLPIRVCDEAAETISHNNPDLPFKLAGEQADLDAQIGQMKAKILAGKARGS